MVIILGYLLALIGALLAYLLSKGKSSKRKYIAWGIALMTLVSPSLSFSIGLTYAVIHHDGWAGMIMFAIFPVIFIIGLIVLLIGIFKRNKREDK